MKIPIILLLSVLTIETTAQPLHDHKVQLTDVKGLHLAVKSESLFAGSVFINDMYQPGRITINGKTYANLNLKLNIEKNLVYFQKDGEEMVPAGVVNVVEFLDPETGKYSQVFRNGFPPIDKNTTQTFYQVLDSGNAMLLKHVGVTLRESQLYGEAAVTKRYEQVKNYYVFVNGNLIPAKKTEEIVEAMKDKKTPIEGYISSNKLKLSKEQDLKLLIAHYNKLQ